MFFGHLILCKKRKGSVDTETNSLSTYTDVIDILLCRAYRYAILGAVTPQQLCEYRQSAEQASYNVKLLITLCSVPILSSRVFLALSIATPRLFWSALPCIC